MTKDKSIPTLAEVCNLSDVERESRIERFRKDLLPLATSTEILPDGRAWEFPREPELERQLDKLVAFERVCCPGPDWELQPVGNGAALRLELTGVDPSLIQGLGPAPEAEQPGRQRLAAIGGAVGVAASVWFLCALPILLATAGAATLADAMAGLDDPAWIGAAAVITGLVTWLILERRAARKSEEAETDCGC